MTNDLLELFFFTRSCKILSRDLTIKLKSSINLNLLIIPFVFKNLFRFILLLEQNNTKKRQIYKIYKNVTNAPYKNTINIIIMKFYYLQNNAVLASKSEAKNNI